MLGLYVHIPFCKSVCGYCDFKKRVPKSKAQIDEYLVYLKKEYEKLNHKFDTIYIGGGTPSMLSIDQLEYLLDIFKDQMPIEYTIECNPENLNLEKIKLLKKYGINRISLGVETFNDDLLKILGRHHTREDVYKIINELKNYFDNINIDLMFSIPKETISNIKYDLECFLELNINHLSYYSLILEPNTPFYIKYMKNELELNNEDDEAKQYEYIIDFLKKFGYNQYEISNFCKNKESIHNKLYWNYEDWIGIGASAASKYKNHRYQNKGQLKDYYNNILEEDFYLENDELLEENIIMSLRLNKGINIKKINELYNVDIFKKFNIDKLINLKLLEINDGYLRLTGRGLLVANSVFEEFIS